MKTYIYLHHHQKQHHHYYHNIHRHYHHHHHHHHARSRLLNVSSSGIFKRRRRPKTHIYLQEITYLCPARWQRIHSKPSEMFWWPQSWHRKHLQLRPMRRRSHQHQHHSGHWERDKGWTNIRAKPRSSYMYTCICFTKEVHTSLILPGHYIINHFAYVQARRYKQPGNQRLCVLSEGIDNSGTHRVKVYPTLNSCYKHDACYYFSLYTIVTIFELESFSVPHAWRHIYVWMLKRNH